MNGLESNKLKPGVKRFRNFCTIFVAIFLRHKNAIALKTENYAQFERRKLIKLWSPFNKFEV